MELFLLSFLWWGKREINLALKILFGHLRQITLLMSDKITEGLSGYVAIQ